MLSDYCNTITTVKITLIAPRVITEWLSTWGPVSFSTELDCRCLLEPIHIFMMGPLRKRINKYNIYKQFLGWGVSLAGRDSPIWETHQCRRPGFDPGIRKITWRRKWLPTPVFLGFPVAQLVRIRQQWGRLGFDPWVGTIPWRRKRLSTPVFWPGEFQGLYSPWGRKESQRHDWATFTSLGKAGLCTNTFSKQLRPPSGHMNSLPSVSSWFEKGKRRSKPESPAGPHYTRKAEY